MGDAGNLGSINSAKPSSQGIDTICKAAAYGDLRAVQVQHLYWASLHDQAPKPGNLVKSSLFMLVLIPLGITMVMPNCIVHDHQRQFPIEQKSRFIKPSRSEKLSRRTSLLRIAA